MCVCVPAVHYDRSCSRRVGHFDTADEGQQSRSVIRNAVIRPASEVELLHLAYFIKTPL